MYVCIDKTSKAPLALSERELASSHTNMDVLVLTHNV